MSSAELATIYQALITLSKEVGLWMKTERVSFKASAIETKGFNNFVSYVDKEAELKFVKALSLLIPESGFIAEEGTSSKKGDRYNWIIDPLDGTTNYVHGIPFYCTSVALLEGDELIMGVVYEPNSDECFSAVKGQGAFMNGAAISVSAQDTLLQSLLATGFPYDDFHRESDYFKVLKDFTKESRGLRRLGSAALDLSYVACGRFDGYYEYGLNPWDVAAGALIVREAGGTVTDFSGQSEYIFGEEIIASNGLIADGLLSRIQPIFGA